MTTPAERVVLVDDNPAFARALARRLSDDGYDTAVAHGIASFRRIFSEAGADLVLLDLNLGREDGLDLALELRRSPQVGVIIMSGRFGVADRIRGLDAGADDYLVKPFAMEELSARVRAVLRRRAATPALAQSLRFGPLRLDAAMHRVSCDGVAQPVELTERETGILDLLIRAGGEPVSREQVLHRPVLTPTDRSVDVHIGHIRRKLAAAGMTAVEVQAVRGSGYRLRLAQAPHDDDDEPFVPPSRGEDGAGG